MIICNLLFFHSTSSIIILFQFLFLQFDLMAAYSAVVSLLQTLHKRNAQLFHGHTAKMLDSLYAMAEYLQKVLENASKSRSI